MPIDRLDWDALRVFRIVAESSSMSQAAIRLGESPPTISRKIDELERALGVEVFTRSTRGVALTNAGQQVLRYAHAMAEAAETLHRETANPGTIVSGTITLGTGDGLGPYWVAPRLAQFHAEQPRVQVRLIVKEGVPDLEAGEVDVAITFTDPRHSDVISHKLGVQHYVGFASRDYIAKHGKPESLFEYHKHRCILHTSYVNQVEHWAPRMSELRKMVDFAFITNSGTAITESCATGGGIGILPSYMAKLDNRLVPLDLPEIAPIRFWLIYTERVRRLPQGKAFIGWLRRLFDSRDAIWFADQFVHPRDHDAKVQELYPVQKKPTAT